MTSDIKPVEAAVTCKECGLAQPYHPVLAVECPDWGVPPGRKCQRPSGHRIRSPHVDRINAAYEAGYTKCPCKTDNVVICAGSTVPEDVPFDTDALTIEEADEETTKEPLDPGSLPHLPCSLGAEGLPLVGESISPSRRSSINSSTDSTQETFSTFTDID